VTGITCDLTTDNRAGARGHFDREVVPVVVPDLNEDRMPTDETIHVAGDERPAGDNRRGAPFPQTGPAPPSG
jgi:hypothetical protein